MNWRTLLAPNIGRAGRATEPRKLPIGVWFLAASMLIFAGSATIHIWQLIFDNWFPGDASVYMLGGNRARDGVELYDDVPENVYFPMLFTYPPFAALLFTGFTLTSPLTVAIGIQAVEIVLVVVCVWASLRMAGRSNDHGVLGAALLLGAAALWFQPVHWTLIAGQINLLLMAVILLDFLTPKHRWWKGVGIGLACAVKLTPAVFILYLLVTKRFHAAAMAVGTFATTVAVGFLVLPRDSAKFWGGAFLDSKRIGPNDFPDNQSFAGVLARYLNEVHPPRPASILISVTTLAIGLGIAWLAHRRGHDLLGVLATAFAGLLASPVSWSHHWVWLVPAGIFLLNAIYNSPTLWKQLAGGVVALMAWAVYAPCAFDSTTADRAGLTASPNFSFGLWETAIASNKVVHYLMLNVDVLLGVAALAAIAYYALRGPMGSTQLAAVVDSTSKTSQTTPKNWSARSREKISSGA